VVFGPAGVNTGDMLVDATEGGMYEFSCTDCEGVLLERAADVGCICSSIYNYKFNSSLAQAANEYINLLEMVLIYMYILWII